MMHLRIMLNTYWMLLGGKAEADES